MLDIPHHELEKIKKSVIEFSKSPKIEMRIENMNSSNDRRKLYTFVQSLGLEAESQFYPNSQNKYFLVKKGVLKKDYDPNQLTVDFCNFYKKYTEFPIPTSLPEHFDYFVEELDQYYQTKDKLELLHDDLKTLGENGELVRQNLGRYKKLLWKIKENIQNTIKQNEEYKKFCDFDVSNLPQIKTSHNAYVKDNENKLLLSFDVRSANFRTLKHFCPSLFTNCNEWKDFISTFTHFKFLQNSKPFRTILINELGNENLNKFAIIFVNDIINKISESEFKDMLKIVSCQNDEVVYEVTDRDLNLGKLFEFVNNVHDFFNIKLFELRQICKENYYVCVLDDKFVAFKNIPKMHIMQVIKEFSNGELKELDYKYVDEQGNIREAENLKL